MKYTSKKYWRICALLDNLNTPNNEYEWSGEAIKNPTYKQTVVCPTCSQIGRGTLYHVICECPALEAIRNEHLSRFKTAITKLLSAKMNKNKRSHGSTHLAPFSLQILQLTLDRFFPTSFIKSTIYPPLNSNDWVPVRVPIAFQTQWETLASDQNMASLLRNDPDASLFSNTIKNKIATLVFEAHQAVWNHYCHLKIKDGENKDREQAPSPGSTQQTNVTPTSQPQQEETSDPSQMQATRVLLLPESTVQPSQEPTQSTTPRKRHQRMPIIANKRAIQGNESTSKNRDAEAPSPSLQRSKRLHRPTQNVKRKCDPIDDKSALKRIRTRSDIHASENAEQTLQPIHPRIQNEEIEPLNHPSRFSDHLVRGGVEGEGEGEGERGGGVSGGGERGNDKTDVVETDV
jgi:hypothetical protein